MFPTHATNLNRTPFAVTNGEGQVISWWPNATRALMTAKAMARKSKAHFYVVDDRSGVILDHYNRP